MFFYFKRMKDYITSFLKLKSENTRRAYGTAIKHLCNHTGCDCNFPSDSCLKSLLKVDAAQAMGYLAAFRDGKNGNGKRHADNTVRHRFNLLLAFYTVLKKGGFIEVNPFERIQKIFPLQREEQVRPTKFFSPAEIKNFLNAPPPDTKEGIRDRAMMAILFGAGLRRSELLELRLADVRISDAGTLFLLIRKAKSGNSRKQSLNKQLGRRLVALLKQRRDEDARGADFLFVSYLRDGRVYSKLSSSTLYRRFYFYTGAACHSARASAATALLALGQDRLDVQNFLGHKSSKMVDTYIKRRLEVDSHPGLLLNFDDDLEVA